MHAARQCIGHRNAGHIRFLGIDKQAESEYAVRVGLDNADLLGVIALPVRIIVIAETDIVIRRRILDDGSGVSSGSAGRMGNRIYGYLFGGLADLNGSRLRCIGIILHRQIHGERTGERRIRIRSEYQLVPSVSKIFGTAEMLRRNRPVNLGNHILRNADDHIVALVHRSLIDGVRNRINCCDTA